MVIKTTTTTRVADHLREAIMRGQWKEFLPGRGRLAAELGVSHMTVSRALAQLEVEGLVVNQGNGLRRRITVPKSGLKSKRLHIAVLRYEAEDTQIFFIIDFVHRLREAGHQVDFAEKTLCGLNMDVKRIARLVGKTKADAWIVISGSDEVLKWFSCRPLPCFALFGHISNLPVAGAGPSKKNAYLTVSRRLVELGHRRIVLITRWAERSFSMKYFMNELEALGIPVGDYNRPRFSDTPEDLQRCLNSLFAVTPPTAIVTMNFELFLAVQQFVNRRKLLVPEDVSLICGDPDPNMAWCRPKIAHISWESSPWVRRIEKWANNIALGKQDTRQVLPDAKFVEGGTIGPAPA